MKKSLENLLISCVTFISLLFGAEFVLGVLSDQPATKPVGRRHILLKEHSPKASKTYDQPITYFTNGESNGVTREIRFEIDAKGYIEPSNILTDPELTIAFLGGSTTECSAVDESKRFPYLVGQLLNENGLRVNTMNAGVSSNNSAHTLNIYLNKVLMEEPNIAVMMHNINDLNLLLARNQYWQVNEVPSHIFAENLTLGSALSHKLTSVFPNIDQRFNTLLWRFQNQPTNPVRRVKKLTDEEKSNIFRQYKENLQLFISISRIKGITPVLMTQANRIKDDCKGIEYTRDIVESRFAMSFQNYKVLYMAMNDIVRELCKEENVLLIDLDAIAGHDQLYDAIHYTDSGSEFVADYISTQLSPLVKQLISE